MLRGTRDLCELDETSGCRSGRKAVAVAWIISLHLRRRSRSITLCRTCFISLWLWFGCAAGVGEGLGSWGAVAVAVAVVGEGGVWGWAVVLLLLDARWVGVWVGSGGGWRSLSVAAAVRLALGSSVALGSAWGLAGDLMEIAEGWVRSIVPWDWPEVAMAFIGGPIGGVRGG